ncbi:MAG: hypothetical protein ACFFDC_00990 [Promethearchaeota archaeon]
MDDIEKIKDIFKTIVALILEYNNVYITRFTEITDIMISNFQDYSKHILDINSQFSNYQLRPDYDQDPMYIERIEQQERELAEKRKMVEDLRSSADFALGQTKLDMDKLNTLLEDLNYLIDDL